MKTTHITIYGPGCTRCTTLVSHTEEAVRTMPGKFEIKKISNPLEIAEAGIFNTPAIAINGTIAQQGKVLSVEQLRELIQDSLDNEHASTATEKEVLTACSCGCGCQRADRNSKSFTNRETKEENQHGKGMKTALILIGFGALAIAALKQIQQEAPVEPVSIPTPVVADNSAELVYFTFGKRCPTCRRMEQWSRDVAKDMGITFVQKEADAEQVNLYGLTTKSLILRDARDEKAWENLSRIWELNRDETAFKQYVREQISTFITR